MPYKDPVKRRENKKEWNRKHTKECGRWYKANYKKYRWNLKIEVLTYYSVDDKPKCSVCGEQDIRVLCIDHIDGDGANQRKELNLHGGWAFYQWLRSNGFPDGYQVLCMNCNWKKRCSEYELYSEVN